MSWRCRLGLHQWREHYRLQVFQHTGVRFFWPLGRICRCCGKERRP